MKYWFVLIALLAPVGVYAQIYKWTDKSGQVHYSQTPPPGQSVGAVDIPESQLGQAAPPAAAQAPASAASRTVATGAASLTKSKAQPAVPKSLSGGSVDDSDQSRCNFARDILSGAVKRSGRRGPIDEDDRVMAQNDVQMFCR